MTALILGVHGLTEEGLRASIRATARTSLLFFLCAFLASSLRTLRRTALTAWLLRNRRYLGVSFAASHTFHLVAVLALVASTRESLSSTTLVGGGIAYAFIAAMTATSFDRTAAWLGPRRWRQLHVTGLYYIWVIFALTYSGSEEPASRFLFALLVGALLARLWLRRRRQGVRDGVVG
jgi:hypothetical protein